MEISTQGRTLVLRGDFDARSTGPVRSALYALLDEQDADVVVDLAEVAQADVTALRVLAVASRYAARDGHVLRLRGCGPSVRRLLHLSHLIRLVELDRDPVAV